MKIMLSIVLSFLMAYTPSVVHANGGMISTSTVAHALDAQRARDTINTYLKRSDVQSALEAQGVSVEEAQQRLASLTTAELERFDGQIQQAQAGGILVAILLVVLIIFLIKRI